MNLSRNSIESILILLVYALLEQIILLLVLALEDLFFCDLVLGIIVPLHDDGDKDILNSSVEDHHEDEQDHLTNDAGLSDIRESLVHYVSQWHGEQPARGYGEIRELVLLVEERDGQENKSEE